MKSVLKKSLALCAAAALLWACEMLDNSEGAAEYALSLSQNGAALAEYTFPARYPGYEDGELEALEVEVSNTGPGIAEGIAISLLGEGSAAFSLSPELIERIEPGNSAAFTVRPVAGLEGGEYQASVAIVTSRGTAQFDVSFTVSTTPLYGIRLDVGEAGHTFQPKAVDYGEAVPLTVTITNIGNEATGALTIASTGENAGSFRVNPSEIASIESGGTETFTVQPVSGLTEGTYTATVTVSGGHDIAAEFPVSFQVFASLIEISTAEELAEIGNKFPADGNYILMDNLVLEDWTPVTNTKTAPFTGVFMGNDKAIKIDSFDPAVLNTDPDLRLVGYIGVFGYIKDGTVTNLTVNLNMPDEQEISNANPGLGEDQYIGGVSGYALNTAFEGITVLGSINLSKGDGGDIYLGGVTGYLEEGSISGSLSQANLTAQEPYSAGNGAAYAGGLTAYVETAELSRCRVEGAIDAYSRRGQVYAGGAAGRTSNSVISYTDTTGNVDAGVSKFKPTIATYGNSARAGGITGFIGGQNVGSQIIKCSSAGNVTSTTYAPDSGDNQLYAGGIVGLTGRFGQSVIIADCYSRGNVTAMTADGFRGGSAEFYAGGIAGQVSLITLENSYAAGIITANSILPADNYTHAGGIAAVMEGQSASTITIRQCAALNTKINWRLYTKDDRILKRIAIRGVQNNSITPGLTKGLERYPENTTLAKNIANKEMVLNYDPSEQQAAKVPPPIVPIPGYDTEDGADCDPIPAEKVYRDLGWDFGAVWKIGSDGYPAFQWQK